MDEFGLEDVQIEGIAIGGQQGFVGRKNIVQCLTTVHGDIDPFRMVRHEYDPFSRIVHRLSDDIAGKVNGILRREEDAYHGRRMVVLIIDRGCFGPQLRGIHVETAYGKPFFLRIQEKREE